MSDRPSLTRTALKFIAILAVSLATWAVLIAPLYDTAVSVVAGQVLRRLESPRMTAGIGVDGAHTVIAHTDEFASRVPVQRLELRTHHNNAPLLLALMLSTPGMVWAKRKTALMIGFGLLALTHVGHFMLTVQMHYAFFNVGPYEVTDLSYFGKGFLESLDNPAQTAKFLVGYAQSFYTHVGRRLIPVLLWIILCWSELTAQARALKAPAAS